MQSDTHKSILKVIFSRRMLVALIMGYVVGLPLELTGFVLKTWMREEGVDLTIIGLFALVGLPYTLKFITAPILDRYTIPMFGRRRGWLLIFQIGLMISVFTLGTTTPGRNPTMVALAALLVAFFSASQDTVIDAYRREDLADEELGFGSSLYVSGYRIGMLIATGGGLILADHMMPHMSGPELTRRLRKDPVTTNIPIIMLTAKVSEDDKVTGLDAGADDYVIKPFSPRELIARINAVLRRTDPDGSDGKITAGDITLDTESRQLFLDGNPTHIGPTEYRLLEFFMTHVNRAYSRSQLLDHVWGTNVFLEERTVDVHIRRLRKILEVANLQHYIQTVRSHGYRFVIEESR